MSEVVLKPKAVLAGSPVSVSEESADGTLLYELDKMAPARSTMFNTNELRVAVERHLGGGTPPRSVASYWKGSIPWASVKDFTDDQTEIATAQESISTAALSASASNLIPAGTPLVCTRMAVGRAALTIVPMAINQDVKALFPAAGVDPRYLLRLLHYVRPKAEAASVGSTVKGIRVQDYLSIVVPQAPSDEQPIIARMLDTLDTTIRQTEAIIAKLKQVKQGLLHDLLTRGTDTNGELRLPQSQAPHLYKQSPLGWIPKEWGALPFKDLADYINGNSFDASGWCESGFPIIRIQNLNGSDQFNYYGGRPDPKWHVHPGDLLFAWSGQRGISFGPRIWKGPEGVLNQHIFKVQERGALISRSFLYRVLKFRQTTIEDSAHGFKDSFLHVTRGELGAVYASLPTLTEQGVIVARVEAFESNLAAEEMMLKKLRAAKFGLMDDLLTGRVRVTALLRSGRP
jgi:type I restriction enzyme S subunit